MAHAICALVLAGKYDPRIAEAFDLRAACTYGDISVLPIDHRFSAYWAARLDVPGALDLPTGLSEDFPRDAVILELVLRITGDAEPRFAVIQTEYFGGVGEEWAVAFHGARRLTGEGASINAAFAELGVEATPEADAFETIGLGSFRANPEYLDATCGSASSSGRVVCRVDVSRVQTQGAARMRVPSLRRAACPASTPPRSNLPRLEIPSVAPAAWCFDGVAQIERHAIADGLIEFSRPDGCRAGPFRHRQTGS